jgi:hypothetical protein
MAHSAPASAIDDAAARARRTWSTSSSSGPTSTTRAVSSPPPLSTSAQAATPSSARTPCLSSRPRRPELPWRAQRTGALVRGARATHAHARPCARARAKLTPRASRCSRVASADLALESRPWRTCCAACGGSVCRRGSAAALIIQAIGADCHAD